jgi:hypothetical protein
VPARASPARRWVEPFAAKASLKFLCIGAVRETEDVMPSVLFDDGMAARCQRQANAESLDCPVMTARAAILGKHDLMREFPVHPVR